LAGCAELVAEIDQPFDIIACPAGTGELTEFIRDFHERHGVLLDWVYVGKALLGLRDVIARGEIAEGSTVVFVITGPDGGARPQGQRVT
jgi:1-aminocyclopropane-1-carboxylate deaminase